jgi:ER-bound oxygenase mpaB/B'/Rubber oxygenase, catalytic domain
VTHNTVAPCVNALTPQFVGVPSKVIGWACVGRGYKPFFAHMGGIRWWDTIQLAELAQEGDPEADALVAELFNQQSLPAVQGLLNTLTRNRDVIPSDLPDNVRRYFETLPVDEDELLKSRRGEAFFAQYGPEVMMVLCCSALPFDYANARGVEVLHRTGFLAKQPNLRVAQTAQMIVDVLSPGGLGPQGHGVRSAQKVRLMHAAIRFLLLADKQVPWDRAALGTPISQLQLLYTLMSFSQVVLVGLRRLGLRVSPDDEQAYLEVWGLVGRIMGIKPSVIPRTVDEANQLTVVLAQQAQGGSPAGEQLTKAISDVVGEVLGPFACLRYSLIRYFTGTSLAKMLGLPRQPPLDWAVGGVAWVVQVVDHLRRDSKDHQLVFRWLTLRLIQLFIDKQLGSSRRLFQIPTAVHDDWKQGVEAAR